MKAGAEHRIRAEAVLDREVIIHEIRRPAGLREHIERSAVELDGRIDFRRSVGLNQVPEYVEAITQPVGVSGSEIVTGCTETSSKSLDAIIGVAVFTRWLIVDRPAGTN